MVGNGVQMTTDKVNYVHLSPLTIASNYHCRNITASRPSTSATAIVSSSFIFSSVAQHSNRRTNRKEVVACQNHRPPLLQRPNPRCPTPPCFQVPLNQRETVPIGTRNFVSSDKCRNNFILSRLRGG
jgi:hypothetical protein